MPAQSRIALVTGGSRGIGRSTVEALSRRGIRSIFTYHRKQADAEEVIAATRGTGARAATLQLDTGNTAAFPAFVAELRGILAEWGAERIDCLVNNADTSHHAPIGDVTEADSPAGMARESVPRLSTRITHLYWLASRMCHPRASRGAGNQEFGDAEDRSHRGSRAPRGHFLLRANPEQVRGAASVIAACPQPRGCLAGAISRRRGGQECSWRLSRKPGQRTG